MKMVNIGIIMNQENVGKRGAEDIMYLEEEMEQLYKIINKRLYNNDLPVPYFFMHNARYRKKEL